jgi:hypothetical protein
MDKTTLHFISTAVLITFMELSWEQIRSVGRVWLDDFWVIDEMEREISNLKNFYKEGSRERKR